MHEKKHYACVVSIAGSDASGGAGIQADIKAISATGGYAAAIITALTAQNTQGVQAVQKISADFIWQQIVSVFSDLSIQAVKIGMLYDSEIIGVVADAMAEFKPQHVVLDPVMIAKNGCALLQPQAILALKEKLFPRVSLITPNIPEAEQLLEKKIHDLSDMQAAAIDLGKHYQTNVLIKGGHLAAPQFSQQCPDVYYNYADQQYVWLHAERIATQNVHGTGCTLSSAIASYLAQGYALLPAINAAKKYLTQAIIAGSDYQLGKGHGPVQHFFDYSE